MLCDSCRDLPHIPGRLPSVTLSPRISTPNANLRQRALQLCSSSLRVSFAAVNCLCCACGGQHCDRRTSGFPRQGLWTRISALRMIFPLPEAVFLPHPHKTAPMRRPNFPFLAQIGMVCTLSIHRTFTSYQFPDIFLSTSTRRQPARHPPTLTHLDNLTSTSPREIIIVGGGLECLVHILHDHRIPPKPSDKQATYCFSLAFQCVVNVGVKGSEPIWSRAVLGVSAVRGARALPSSVRPCQYALFRCSTCSL